ncbi:MAG: 1-acyl-sn-glycerol-3-phosphate acyltransferase [Alphaproteobacteria bacterium]|nr:1-acyl-sn-glycerol-3-phosphate acyltransferase [Alphaproteobacteria bacterium]
MLQWTRSLLFNAQMYLSMLVLGILYFPYALISSEGALKACHTYCRWIVWTASWIIGLKVEIRGTPPTDEVMVAAKHQSFFDVIVIFGAVPRGKFIMKRLLMYAPILGQYGMRIGNVPVNRGKRGAAIEKMVRDVKNGTQRAGQLIIYPQGTRVAPGATRPYKVGTGVLYEQLQQDCVPVATNIGVFWPKRGITRRPGTAVVEFLPRIKAGMERPEFMKELEMSIETHSNRLMAEAGFHAND